MFVWDLLLLHFENAFLVSQQRQQNVFMVDRDITSLSKNNKLINIFYIERKISRLGVNSFDGCKRLTKVNS